MTEEWKDIESMKGYYQVSSFGNIRKSNGKERKLIIGTTGYYSTSFYVCGETMFKKVHRLVAAAFIPNPNGHPCVNHIDGNKLNNHYLNLEWCTHKYNASHARSSGLVITAKGEEAARAKLKEHQVIDIIVLSASGESQRKLASKFGISRRAIRSILDGKSWKHILRSI